MSVHGLGSPKDASGTVAAATEREKPKAESTSQAHAGKASDVTKPLPAKVSPGAAREPKKPVLDRVPISRVGPGVPNYGRDPELMTAVERINAIPSIHGLSVRFEDDRDIGQNDRQSAIGAELARAVGDFLKLRTGENPSYADVQRAADELLAAFYGIKFPGVTLAGKSAAAGNLTAACNYVVKEFVLHPRNQGGDAAQKEKHFSNLIAWIMTRANEDPQGYEAFNRLEEATDEFGPKEVRRILVRLWNKHLAEKFPIPRDIPAWRIDAVENRLPQAKSLDGEWLTIVMRKDDFRAAKFIAAYRPEIKLDSVPPDN